MTAPAVGLPMRTLLRSLARDERGSVLPLVGLCMTVILGFAALAIDLGQQTAMRTQLEATADAAALAAAAQLPDESKARKKALEYAEQNMPPEAHGQVLDEEDIVFGTWYAETRQFVIDGPVANAVQVTVRRSERAERESRADLLPPHLRLRPCRPRGAVARRQRAVQRLRR
jgi:uncharacterized membrane protein